MALEEEASREEPVAQKSASSSLALFLSYITDLVFVSIVGLVLFLTSWFLWHYSNSMFMRFTGLGVASFGYVLAIFFFLDTNFLFFSKRDC
jgi:hypothetical protein